jgi:proteasome lid subunit RPN8/RPN11
LNLDALKMELTHRARTARNNGHEKCGFIGLSSRDEQRQQEHTSWRLFDMLNVYEGDGHYRMDVQEQLQRFAELQASGIRLWGVFHTHTVSNNPSANDAATWTYPPALHMVIATPANVTVWVFDGRAMVPSSWED